MFKLLVDISVVLLLVSGPSRAIVR